MQALWAQAQMDPSTIRTHLDSLRKEVPALNETVDFTLVEAPLYELLRAVAETHGLNVNFRDLPQVTVTNNFTNVTVSDLIVFLVEEYDLQLRFNNNIFTFYYEQPVIPREPIVSYNPNTRIIGLNIKDEAVSLVAREITENTDYNLIYSQELSGLRMSGFVRNLPFETAIINLAEINGMLVEKKSDRVFMLQPAFVEGDNRRGSLGRGASDFELETYRVMGSAYINLKCMRKPIVELIRTISDQLSIDYLFMAEPKGTMDCRMDSVRFLDFLTIALESANLSYTLVDKVFVIGETQKNGLDVTRVFSFKNRSVEGVDEVIPASLIQQVQIKLFQDLNALIITGSDKAAAKLVDFLQQIDVAVPNVLIEVIVAEFRKGTSLRTGVQAFLSDSVPATDGQIFGGVDVTMSSASINRILSNLESKGISNLGRVTPQFYATIQAMEDNNNLNIRSTPKLSTLNGHEATLTIGQSVYYLIETQNVTGGVNPIVTVTPRYERVEANLSLKISPFVSDLEDVTLTIDAEFSDFIPPTVKGAPPGNATRKFISKIRVKNEEMVVLGGLEEVSKSETGAGVPFLSRIPVLKWLFSSKTKENSESKLLIFIKPTIVY